MQVELIFPLPDNDDVSIGLRKLTRLIHESGIANGEQGGLFGGEFGYGANFENETFLFHRYCWCEHIGCPWCYGCFCGNNSWRDEHETTGDELCSWCRGVHLYSEQGALPPTAEPHNAAPNFWHKSTGTRIWWYKYIGRDMKVVTESEWEWRAVLADCARSLRNEKPA